MPESYDPNIFNVGPYYDDFDDSKQYLRTLFKPGFAIQARELTQIQTLLQNQVESMGSHIFERGAVIAGGGIAEASINYARLDTTNTLSTTALEGLVGSNITNGTATARVLKTLGGSTLAGDPNQMVFYQFITNGLFSEGDIITSQNSSGTTFSINSSGSTAANIGTDATFVSISEGIFYIDGFFIKSLESSNVPFNVSGSTYSDGGDDRYRDFSTPTCSVGWKLTKEIVDSNEDSTLRDPAAGFYNYNAPGADRYKIGLDLDFIPFSGNIGDAVGLTFDGSNFIELVRFVSGSSTKTVRYTEYAEIEETLARRTFDESGSYTVNSPKIRVEEHSAAFSPSDSSKVAIGVEPNKSYVRGFEVDTQSTVFLESDKPRTVGAVASYGERLNAQVGNYVLIDGASSGFGNFQTSGGFNSNSFDKCSQYIIYSVDVFGSYSEAGSTVGTCRVKNIVRDGSDIKLGLLNTNINSGKNFTEARYLVADTTVAEGGHTGTTGCFYKILSDSSGWTGPYDADQRSLIYPVDNDRLIKDGPGFDSQKNSVFVVYETSFLNFESGKTQSDFVDMSGGKSLLDSDDDNYAVFYTQNVSAGTTAGLLDTSNYSVTVFNPGAPNSRLRVDVADSIKPTAAVSGCVVHPIVYDSANITTSEKIYRTLTIDTVSAETTTTATTVNRGGVTAAEFTLSSSHVIAVQSILRDGGVDISSSIDNYDHLDDGQRKASINKAKLYIPISNLLASQGEYTVDVTYTKYTHSGIGPATVNSYPDSYEDIPSFTDPNSGERISPRDHIDFRPVQNSDGTYTNFGVPFYKNNSFFSRVGYSYYLPRVDSVVLGSDSVYRIIKGVPSDNPQPPSVSQEDMELYSVKYKPYVFDVSQDITTKYIENKRYSMREIGEIENSVDSVERDRFYEILFNDAVARGAADSLGSPIEESVIVDDFSSQSFADVVNRDHNCSIDYRNRGLLPSFTTKGIGLQSTSIPDGMTLSEGRNLYYSFSEINVLQGVTGTGTLEINPFGVTDFLGFMDIEPKTDFYYDNESNPSVLLNTFGENNQYFIATNGWTPGRQSGWGGQRSEWLIHWFGEEDQDISLRQIDPLSRSYKNPVKSARAKLPDRVKRTVNNKVVDESVVPKMRSVGITFSAEGMLAGSTVYAFFDNDQVGNTSGYTVNDFGVVEGHVTVGSNVASGEKNFRITDSSTNTLSQTNTAADSKFFAQGLLSYKNSTVIADIPAESRRKSTKSDAVTNSMFTNTLSGNFSSVQNGLEPLSQEIIVDAGAFPQGVFLSSVETYFSSVDSEIPVSVCIKPMINGAPHEFLVVPHSNKTLQPTTVGDGPSRSLGTKFTFKNPVYLPPGNFAVCFYSNSSLNTLFTATIGEEYLETDGTVNSEGNLQESLSVVGNGIKYGSLFLPLNNGTRSKQTNEAVMMEVNRCKFDGGSKTAASRRAVFSADLSGSTASAHSLVLSCNDQVFTSETVSPSFEIADNSSGNIYVGVTPNKDLDLIGESTYTTDGELEVRIDFSETTSDTLSPVINTDRLGVVAVHDEYSNASFPNDTGSIVGETQSNAASSQGRARYISKQITFGNQTANDIRVYLDIAPKQGHVKVFAKFNTSGDEFDSQDYVQLYRDGDSNNEFENASNTNSLTTNTFKPISSPGEFSSYSIKVVMFAPNGSSHQVLPEIKNLRSVAMVIGS